MTKRRRSSRRASSPRKKARKVKKTAGKKRYKVRYASTTVLDALAPHVKLVLAAVARHAPWSPAFASDRARIAFFLEDPGSRESVAVLAAISAELGVPVAASDLVTEVAIKIRDAGLVAHVKSSSTWGEAMRRRAAKQDGRRIPPRLLGLVGHTVYSYRGIKVEILYSEAAPPNVHVSLDDDYHVVVYLDEPTVKRGHLPEWARRLVTRWVRAHARELSEAWERARRGLPVKEVEMP